MEIYVIGYTSIFSLPFVYTYSLIAPLHTINTNIFVYV